MDKSEVMLKISIKKSDLEQDVFEPYSNIVRKAESKMSDLRLAWGDISIKMADSHLRGDTADDSINIGIESLKELEETAEIYREALRLEAKILFNKLKEYYGFE